VLEQAAALGLEVTVLVRDPARLGGTMSSVRVAVGDICVDSPAVRDAFAGQDAVISSLGVGQSFKPGGLIARAAPAIVAAMRQHGAQRLVFTSAFGIGLTWQDTPLVPRVFIRTLLRTVYADKTTGEDVIRRSALDWTIVYPAGLTNGPRTGASRVGEHLKLSGFPRVSRADVASVLLRQVDDATFLRKGVLVAD
jgi:putative NADH-flavin reductase